jgi:hypothetical protein
MVADATLAACATRPRQPSKQKLPAARERRVDAARVRVVVKPHAGQRPLAAAAVQTYITRDNRTVKQFVWRRR